MCRWSDVLNIFRRLDLILRWVAQNLLRWPVVYVWGINSGHVDDELLTAIDGFLRFLMIRNASCHSSGSEVCSTSCVGVFGCWVLGVII